MKTAVCQQASWVSWGARRKSADMLLNLTITVGKTWTEVKERDKRREEARSLNYAFLKDQ